MNWLFITVSFFVVVVVFLFAAAVSLFLLQGRSTEKVLLHHMHQASVLEDFVTIMKCFWTTCEACTQQCAWLLKRLFFCRSWRFDFLAQNYELLQSNNCLLGCERVMETQAEFHFSWVYTFSAMLSSLQNWANNDRYQIPVATQHSRATVLIIQQTATSSKQWPY